MSRKLSVLIFDDDLTIQRVINAFLKQFCLDFNYQCTVEVCSNSIDCLFQLHDNGEKLDIIMLDILTPGVDGVALFTSILYSNPKLTSRVAFLTTAPEIIKESFPDLPLNILEKPFGYDAFCKTLNYMLAKHSQKSAPPNQLVTHS